MNIETMRLLVEKGLSAADILEVAETMAAPSKRSAAAERQARYRARLKGDDVTCDVTGDGNGDDNTPLPRPLSPQTPQTPTPTPGDISRTRGSDPFPCPEWAEPAVWRDLKANRQRKRLANTATAHTKLIRDIEGLADDEWPPGKLLEAIVAKGWGAAYDPREKPNDKRNSNTNRGGSTASAASLAMQRLGYT